MRPKIQGFVTHMSTVVGHGLVLHNTPEKGEHIATVEEFAAGQPVAVKQTGANPQAVVERARKIVSNPQGYHPVKRNCEHTVFEVVYGIAKSPQFIFWASVAIVAVVIGIILLCFNRR